MFVQSLIKKTTKSFVCKAKCYQTEGPYWEMVAWACLKCWLYEMYQIPSSVESRVETEGNIFQLGPTMFGK